MLNKLNYQLLNLIFVWIRRIVNLSLYLWDRLWGRKNRAVILVYHGIGDDDWLSVSEESFREQMDWLIRNYQVVSLSEIKDYIEGKRELDKSLAAITFDDGFESVLKVKDYLQKKGIKPMVSVLAEPDKADKKQLGNESGLLDIQQLKELQRGGWEIGCHSATHADFNQLRKDEITIEVMEAKEILEKQLKAKVNYFVYPKGRYNDEILETVGRSGYRLGLTMDDGIISKGTDRLRIPRMGVNGTHELDEFMALMSPSVVRMRRWVKIFFGYLFQTLSFPRRRESRLDPHLREDDTVTSVERLFKSNKPQIDVVEKYFYPVTAGIEVNMLETYSVLVKNGWQVKVHTSRDTLNERGVLSVREKIRGMDVRRYDYSPWHGFFPDIDWQGTSVVALHNFNIFPHLHILLRALIYRCLGRKRFVLVLTPHGGFNPEWAVFPWWQRWFKRFYHQTIGRWLINEVVDGVRAVSEWERQEMIKSGVNEKLIRVISNGIEDAAFKDLEKVASKEIKAKVKQWGKYLVRIGRIYPIKNDETVIKALPYIPQQINLVIIGSVEKNQHPEYFDYLKRLAKDLGVADRVIFAGVIRDVDKFYAIKHAQMMTHMALWESFCIVVLEGMSQGIPCIVANNTALPLLIKDGVNGYCVETQDYKALAKKINYVLKNKSVNKLKKMARINKDYGAQNAWKKVAGKMNKWYRELVGEGELKSVDFNLSNEFQLMITS